MRIWLTYTMDKAEMKAAKAAMNSGLTATSISFKLCLCPPFASNSEMFVEMYFCSLMVM